MKNSEILKMLASTKSDDFVVAGEEFGMKTYEVIVALLSANDPRLILRSLQIAFALGSKAHAKASMVVIDNCDFLIDEKISNAQYDELSTPEEKEEHINARVENIRMKRITNSSSPTRLPQ